MNKRNLYIVAILIGVGLLTFSGCQFLGGQEQEYTYWEPMLSPDGVMIVYVYESAEETSLELFTLDLSANTKRQLTSNEYPDWSPSWSPDGARITFASVRDENVDIYLIDVDSRQVIRITTHAADDINPSWGSDGLIYFNSNRSDTWEAYNIDPDSLVLKKLTSLDAHTP